MKIVFVSILKLIFISSASSQSDAPCHVCEYGGVNYDPTVDIPFSVSNIPKRCKIVTYGAYHFNGSRVDDEHMFKHDESAIKAMVKAGIPVYTYAGYSVGSDTWNEILDPNNQAIFNDLICPFIDKMKELQITGIILNILSVYTIHDGANKISAFITKIKEQFPGLKYILTINGHDDFEKFPKKELFDYSVTNSVIDLYFIDTHTHEFKCTPDLAKSGNPITSPDDKVLSLEKICNAVSQSAMDKTKIIACVIIFPLTPHALEIYTPYSKYCDDLSSARAELWCLDKSQRLYDIGAFIKKQNFVGVAVDWIEWDDVQGVCQCDKFPVTNLIFDGFDGKPFKSCPKIC